ncbi:MAG: TetR/AcrR family transcriptional regulator [Prevotellaceae bacterium]|jgi:AcrR family transcriptional regulator|nr:TetR/AcrR family transcriptional regulator [Prevotellaceae bacterium]
MKTEENPQEPTQRQELRNHILDMALQLFTSHGIKSITMDDIAASMSISKRTLYEVFADKETLLIACLQKSQHEADVYIKRVYDSSSNVMEVILRLYESSIERLHHFNKRFFEDLKRYPKVNELVEERRNRDTKEKMDFFKEGVAQGLFRGDINFAIMNDLVQGQLDLLMYTNLNTKYSFLEVYEAIMFTYLRGITTEKGANLLDTFIKAYRTNQKQ